MTSTPQGPGLDPVDTRDRSRDQEAATDRGAGGESPAQADSDAGSSAGTGEGRSALEEPGMGEGDYVDEGVLPEPDTRNR